MQEYNYLAHHGIKGQRWGVRRFQNEDGSVTAAGAKRYYNTDTEGAKKQLKKAEARLRRSNTHVSTAYTRQKNYAAVRYRKEQYNNEKIKEKLNSETKTSKSRLALEAKYKEKGMSDEDAAVAAYKHERTKKIIVGAVATAAVVGGSVVAYKYASTNLDGLIKPGTEIRNISKYSDKGVSDAFYASRSKLDGIKYKSHFGRHDGITYEMTAKVGEKGIKSMGSKTGAKLLKDMVDSNQLSSDDLKNYLREWNNNNSMNDKQRNTITKAIGSLRNGEINKSVYEAFNLTFAGNYNNETVKSFYNIAKSSGYNAIKDINDRKMSEFNSKTADIIIGGKDAVTNVANRAINSAEINKANNVVIGLAFVKATSPYIPVAVIAEAGGKKFTKKIDNVNNNRIIKAYKKKHPETELSDKEILNNYYG